MNLFGKQKVTKSWQADLTWELPKINALTSIYIDCWQEKNWLEKNIPTQAFLSVKGSEKFW